MSGEPVVRPRRPDDLAACVDLLRVTHATDGYPVRASAVSADWLTTPAGTPAWVALVGDAVVGHVAAVRHDAAGTVEVSRLFTDPSARGGGVGRRLLEVVVDHARAHGRPVVLEVVDGSPAVEFYRRQGWRETGSHVAAWAGDDGVHPTVRTFTLERQPSSGS